MAAGVPVLAVVPHARFVVVGDGLMRADLEQRAAVLGIEELLLDPAAVEELGSRGRDVAAVHSHGYLVDRMEAMSTAWKRCRPHGGDVPLPGPTGRPLRLMPAPDPDRGPVQGLAVGLPGVGAGGALVRRRGSG
jgi:hypothetical protein